MYYRRRSVWMYGCMDVWMYGCMVYGCINTPWKLGHPKYLIHVKSTKFELYRVRVGHKLRERERERVL
jgi:hypothetical protein